MFRVRTLGSSRPALGLLGMYRLMHERGFSRASVGLAERRGVSDVGL